MKYTLIGLPLVFLLVCCSTKYQYIKEDLVGDRGAIKVIAVPDYLFPYDAVGAAWCPIPTLGIIFLAETYTETSDSITSEKIMLHELGHCLKWLTHSEDCVNIMYAEDNCVSDDMWIRNRTKYIQEILDAN